MSDTVISSVFICPKCKYTNPSKSKFCMQCGTPLASDNKSTNAGKISLMEKGVSVKEFPIETKITIGKDNEISIDGANFSKNICEFNLADQKLTIKTLKDGVFLKLTPGSVIELQSGTDLKIGEKDFRVEF